MATEDRVIDIVVDPEGQITDGVMAEVEDVWQKRMSTENMIITVDLR